MQPDGQDRYEAFDGFGELLNLIRTMLVRQRKITTRPVFTLIQASLMQYPGLLRAISDRCSSPDGRRHVPHAFVQLALPDGAHQAPDPVPVPFTHHDIREVREVLLKVAACLERGPGGMYHLPRFRVVTWLMSVTLRPGSARERYRQLRRELRIRTLVPANDDNGQPVGNVLPEKWRNAIVLLTPPFLRVVHNGRVPGMWARYGWFLQQPNLTPVLYGNFVALAERLTADQWTQEDPDQIIRLMVNAFLADLRSAFRGPGWVNRYRTTYPLVLLDRISRANGGYALLRVINEIRNDPAIDDPLMLITSSRLVPPRANQADAGAIPTAAEIQAAFDGWEHAYRERQRRREDDATLLRGGIPEPAEVPPPVPGHITRRSRPFWRTRRAAIVVVVGVLVAAGTTYGTFGVQHNLAVCGDGFTWLGLDPLESDVTRWNGQCVGVTDGSNPQVLPRSPLFETVRTKILELNNAATMAQQLEPDRPLITLVFLGSLTATADGDEQLSAEREQLAGMAVVQSVQLAKSNQAKEPLVRVLIANGGTGMAYGQQIAAQLGRMSREDPGIVAVVGLNESRQSTADTIAALGREGLPVVAATLSADTLVGSSQMYFQTSPQNIREASVAADYVQHLIDEQGQPLERRVRLYYSDDETDTYSQNLAADMKATFEGNGFEVKLISFTASGNLSGGGISDPSLAGRSSCGFGGVVAYAARPLPDFQAFISGIGDGCRGAPPFVLAGDDVSRYVADRGISEANRSIPFHYLSFAVSPEQASAVPPEAADFYQALNTLFPYEVDTDRGRSLTVTRQ